MAVCINNNNKQGDPLVPLLFSLVLHKVVSYIAQDRECLPLLFNGWYLDDGVLLGHPGKKSYLRS